MSTTTFPTISDELALVTGGEIKADPYAAVGTPERCAYLEKEIPSRERMILSNAIRGTSNGGGPEALGRAVYGDAAILSRDRMEHRLRCPRG